MAIAALKGIWSQSKFETIMGSTWEKECVIMFEINHIRGKWRFVIRTTDAAITTANFLQEKPWFHFQF
jgi:hypothetical protein